MTTRTATTAIALAAIAMLARPATAHAQRQQQQPPAAAGDSARLGALQADAVRRDPRARELQLLASQSALRERSLNVERLPTVGANAQGQYQSEVVAIPLALPGLALPTPPHDTYDAHVEARERIYDPTLGGRRAVERAQLAESQARVRAALYTLRQNVDDAFFGALRLQAQADEVATAIADLEAQLRVATERVRQGAALPSDSALLAAELLRRRQSLDELATDRDAALAVLGDLTGRSFTTAASLALPELGAEVARARASLDSLRARPEYAQFAASREVLARQREATAARDRPRVSAFGRAGYGRPGLNPLARDFTDYWLAGVQVEWSPWNWGTTDRDREVLALQQQVVRSEEAAFAESVRRGVVRDLATIDRLARALVDDDAIVALREQALRETRLRFGEGVVTSAEYVDRETDVVAARLARAAHRVELAQARARFLTTVGVEVR